jgi:hypothetical protein
MKEYDFILDRRMASFMLRRVFQRGFSQTTFQRQIIQEDSKINLQINIYFIDQFCRYDTIEKR